MRTEQLRIAKSSPRAVTRPAPKEERDAYRPEIDGLRGLAVLPVICFHYGVDGFSGGYVGVDVFFVISGFLIVGIIDRETSDGSFSVARFYERRIRRIIPALVVMLLSSTVVAVWTLLPQQLNNFGKSTVVTVLFSSNIYFWTQSGYFAPRSEMSPLLHAWSLSLEEQFYIIVPAIMIILTWVGRRVSACESKKLKVAVLAIIGAASFLLCFDMTINSPSAAFFMLPTRAWELLAGALLAIAPIGGAPLIREIASLAGMLLIVAAVVAYDRRTPFPGVSAVLPVAGAVLVIWGGRSTVGGRILSFPPMVRVGLISYSLYLWHWPILVFAKQMRAEVELPSQWTFACFVVMTVLSFFTWRFVERPFRRAAIDRGRLFAGTAAVLALCIGAGLLPIVWDGMPARFSKQTVAFANTSFSAEGQACLTRSARAPLDFCEFGPDRPTFVVWGDSHAGALFPAIERAAKLANRSGLFAGFNGCHPLFMIPPALQGRDREKCSDRNRGVAERIRSDPSVTTVILAAFWSAYSFTGSDLQTVLDVVGQRDVVLLADTPTPGFDVPWALALGNTSRRISRSRDPDAFVIAAKYSNVRIVHLSESLCQGESCGAAIGEHALYSDGNHLSAFAADNIVGPYLVGRLFK